MAIKFVDSDGKAPISERQFARLKCRGDYRFTDEEYDAFEKVVYDAGLDYIAVKQAEIAGVTYDFIYDLEEGILYNLRDGVALVEDAADIGCVSDEEFDPWQYAWKKLLVRLGVNPRN